MSALDRIAIQVAPPPQSTHNALPLLHEVRHALTRLAASAETTTIDLRAVPFAPGEVEGLLGFLGKGEIYATLTAMGETRIWESRFPGVWIVDHRDVDDQSIALQIEVCEIPSLLRTPTEDVHDSVLRLQEELAQSPRS
ncbi:hydrogenase expression/formation C-terminal domain-containing protein [Endothiovibrio diazotrophicus]